MRKNVYDPGHRRPGSSAGADLHLRENRTVQPHPLPTALGGGLPAQRPDPVVGAPGRLAGRMAAEAVGPPVTSEAIEVPDPGLPRVVAVLFPVQVVLHIFSSVPGRTGNWSMTKTVHLTRIPVAGDLISHDGGWGSETVKHVTLCDGGEVEAYLMPITTDSPQTLDELAKLVAEHGWEQHAGPWAGRSA
jgi:hypothetical protein